MPEDEKTTHFGFEEVEQASKQRRVDAVFSSVAKRYDVMNDLMSFGLHRLWKRMAIAHLRLQPNHLVCEVAAGTGDLTQQIAKKLSTGSVVMSDINPQMLRLGRDRLFDAGLYEPKVLPVLANGQDLPFASSQFDRMICAFGMRNMTDPKAGLAEAYRCLKMGGRLVVLEFSTMQIAGLEKLYDHYSFNVIPKLGEWVTNDADSYQYLVESIRRHPDQKTFASWFEEAGFAQVNDYQLAAGAVAIHVGIKL